MTEQSQAGAARLLRTLFALSAVAGKSRKYISAPTWDARYIPIVRAPESHWYLYPAGVVTSVDSWIKATHQ